MFTIVWNSRGFHLIKVLENGRKFNAGYYITEILNPLPQWRSIEAAGNKRRLLVHADNARPHPAKLSTQYFNENRFKSAPYPPNSPDLAPSDFYLFRYVKKCLAGLSFEDADEFLAAVGGVIKGIEK
jgi:histone-lysine N-methyltransferase SETMAR